MIDNWWLMIDDICYLDHCLGTWHDWCLDHKHLQLVFCQLLWEESGEQCREKHEQSHRVCQVFLASLYINHVPDDMNRLLQLQWLSTFIVGETLSLATLYKHHNLIHPLLFNTVTHQLPGESWFDQWLSDESRFHHTIMVSGGLKGMLPGNCGSGTSYLLLQTSDSSW